MGNQVRAITVPNRDSAGWLHGTKDVLASWVCPTCRKPMGEPQLQNFCEDGEFYYVHVWDNKCGHIAKYTDLILVQPEGVVSGN
ncbi:hypothetical protein BK142_14850 [Paenibacillus glucanolyticus]|nr:hypothetical protein BK142_14850 [Paenibacillus glucanolyticus]